MPLIASVLEMELKRFVAKDDPLFVDFPSSPADAATKWADAFNTYAQAVIPPSTTAAAAKSALEGILMAMDPNAGNLPTLLQSGLTAYAAALGGGMSPLYTAVPPPVPVVFDPVYNAGLGGADGAACCAMMATIADAWFKTGQAILVAPPNTATPWS